MSELTVADATNRIYQSLEADNADIDLHIAALKEALKREGLKEVLLDPARLAQNNRVRPQAAAGLLPPARREGHIRVFVTRSGHRPAVYPAARVLHSLRTSVSACRRLSAVTLLIGLAPGFSPARPSAVLQPGAP